jgi:hypothetical protein
MAKVMINLNIDFDTLGTTTSGSITSKVWLSYGDKVFPHVDWYDFPIAVLLSFLRKREDLLIKDCEFFFFDGPVSWVLQSSGEVRFLHQSKIISKFFLNRLQIESVISSIEKTSKELIEACRLRGMPENHEFSELARLLQ